MAEPIRGLESAPDEPSQDPLPAAPPTPANPIQTEAFTPCPATATGAQTSPGSAADSLAEFAVSARVIDGYETFEILGRGGMGIVYKAKQPKTGQTVALKMIRDKCFADKESLDRFLREVAALGRVQPARNIVPIYLVGQHEQHPYFVMPYLSGGTLATKLRHFQTQPRRAVELVEKVARAVHQLHLRQILHRDIKPGNILLDAEGEPFLGDFGLIKLLDDPGLTQTQQRLGTPAYMAPEQTGLVPTPATAQTDIWALGVVLYEVLTGTRPFVVPKEEDTSTLLWRIVHDEPPRPRTLNPEVDAGLEAVILKCLEKSPGDRFQSAEELANELARWLKHGAVQTRRAPLRRFLYRRRWLVATIAFLAISGLTAAVVWHRYDADARLRSPEHILKTLQDEFKETGKLDLVLEKEPPRWHQPAIKSKVDTSENYHGYWLIETWDVGVIDLFRFRADIPQGAYKIRAEFAHLKTDVPVANPYVGVFIDHDAPSAERKVPHALCNLVFNDINDETRNQPKPGLVKGNRARLKYRLYKDTEVQAPVDDMIGWTKAPYFTYAGAAKPQWRVVEIESHPDRIVCMFDGQPMEPLDRAYGDREFQKWFTKVQGDFPARYGPIGDMTDIKPAHRGSLGLVVSRGSIAVRSVTLTRLAK